MIAAACRPAELANRRRRRRGGGGDRGPSPCPWHGRGPCLDDGRRDRRRRLRLDHRHPPRRAAPAEGAVAVAEAEACAGVEAAWAAVVVEALEAAALFLAGAWAFRAWALAAAWVSASLA